MDYVQNVIDAITPWWTTITILCYVIGIALGLFAAFQSVNSRNKFDTFSGLWTVIAAIFMLNLPAFLNSVSLSIFSANSTQTLSYTSDASYASEYITFAVRAVMLIGLVSVIRGTNFLRDTPQRAKDIPRAIVHVVSGTLAINIVQFFQGIGATVGGDVQSYIEAII